MVITPKKSLGMNLAISGSLGSEKLFHLIKSIRRLYCSCHPGQCDLKTRTTPYSPAITFFADIVHKVPISADDNGLFLRSDLFSIEITVKDDKFHVPPHLTVDKAT